jgi:hypothetical protein
VKTAAKSTTLKTAGVARIEARCRSGLLRSAPIVVEKPPLRTTGVASGRLWTAQGELKPLISTPFPSLQSCCLLTAACVLTNEKTADGLPRVGYLLRLTLNFYLIRGKPSLANNHMQSNCWSCVYDLVGLRLLSYSFSREGLKVGIATGTMFGSQSYRLPLASDPFSFKKFAANTPHFFPTSLWSIPPTVPSALRCFAIALSLSACAVVGFGYLLISSLEPYLSISRMQIVCASVCWLCVTFLLCHQSFLLVYTFRRRVISTSSAPPGYVLCGLGS